MSSAPCDTASGVLVNFYHGFHQAGRMDRQELRLVFERGDVTLYDWVPTRVRVHAIVDEAQTRALCDLFPGARLDVTGPTGPRIAPARAAAQVARHLPDGRAAWGDGDDKSHRYGELLRAVMADQLAWIRDHSHRGRSPRRTAAIRWPSPAKPTGWPRRDPTAERREEPQEDRTEC